MTDEEKAKEYLKDICPICNDREMCRQDGCLCYIQEAYIDGLAEGRKEKCLEQNNDGTIRPCEVMKENEILTNRILELQKTCGALTDKVEKMKNCKNCSYGMNGGCDYYNAVPDKVQNCEHWRLAE